MFDDKDDDDDPRVDDDVLFELSGVLNGPWVYERRFERTLD